MRTIKVVLDFIQFPVAEKVAFYRNVITQLTGNPLFPTPDMSLADAKAAVDTLETSALAARDGGHTAVSIVHDNEAAADRIFRLLAAYIDRIAAGDETSILSSGFHESKQPSRMPKAALSVIDGAHSGSVKLIAKAVDKAGAYHWQCVEGALPETEAGWLMAGSSTQASFEISGLAVGSKHYFRVAAITPNGVTDFSAPVMKVVV